MAIIPVRRLGDIGIITDVNPYDLPPNALSQGNNLRFHNGSILRSPVFKEIYATTAITPVFAFTFRTSGNTDKIGIAGKDGSLYFYANDIEEDVTPASFTPADSSEPHTFCTLGNVGYVNRNTAVPMYYQEGSTDFDELPNWPATYTCKALRSFKSYLIALNITKASNQNPTMVKWSDVTVTNSYPVSWDETDPTKSAGENTLDDLQTELLDGLTLRDAFVCYAEDQVHLMEYTADNFIFRFRKIFDGIGIINTNCVVEVDGRHYVFGKDDIYVHDTVSWQSIIKGKNKDYVFNSLNASSSDTFYVAYNPSLNEIMFCYVSGDGEAGFTDTPYPNRAAVFNPENGTWSFRDLPNCGGATAATYNPASVTWASTTNTWKNVGTSWYSLENSSPKTMFFVAAAEIPSGVGDSRLLGYDTILNGHLLQPQLAEANKPSWAERIGIDMDETGEQLRAYKVVRTIYPQAQSQGGVDNLSFSFGATEFNDLQPVLGDPVLFDSATQHKVDCRFGGRYLAWRCTNDTDYSMSLSGFDIDVATTGRR
jgi:hypothetical protein